MKLNPYVHLGMLVGIMWFNVRVVSTTVLKTLADWSISTGQIGVG